MTMTPIEMVKLHAKFKNFTNDIQVTVAIHSKEMRKDTESEILKKTGLKK